MARKCPKCHSENPETKQFCADCGTQLPPPQSHPPVMTETLQTPVRELTTGATFAGRYQVIEELGHGGMGRVYKVQDTDIKEKVALKLLRPEITLDQEAVERFSNELKLARKISHRNVCRMFDLGRAEGTTFITMEFVPGEDLRSFIHRSKQLSIGNAMSIAKQVCEGLEEAHRLGVIHRDLKPANIMIDKDGDAKIMDFGIARSLSGKSITGAGVMIGTPEYMSPEQVEGKDIDQRSDIYSLGVILYEMVTGRLPFSGDTPLSVAHKHKYEAPKDPKSLNPSIPDSLSDPILKCLEKDKAKRYQNAVDLRIELERIEKGLPTTERVASEQKTSISKEITVSFRPTKLIIPAVAITAVIIAAIFFWPKRTPDLDPNLVAVAIFENKTGDPRLDNIGSLARERIMQGLEQVGQFSVAPVPPVREPIAEPKGKDRLDALTEMTKAGKIVYGAYYLQGDKLQFHAWVQDMVSKKNIVPLEPVSGPVDDPAATLEPLRLKLMGGLAGIFDTMLNYAFVLMKQPPSFEAYRDYVEAIKAYIRGEGSRTIDLFLRAYEKDPNLHIALMYVGFSYIQWLGDYPKADEFSNKVEIFWADLSTGERYLLEGLQAWIRGDQEAELRVVRKISSLHWVWNFWHASLAIDNNCPAEALDRLEKYHPYDEAWEELSDGYWRNLTTAHHMLGNHKRELKEARRGRKQYPEMLSMLANEIRALAALGRPKDINALLEESKALPPENGYSPGNIALRAGLELRAHGFKDESIRVLNQARQWFGSRSNEDKAAIGNRYGLARTLYALGEWREAEVLFEGLHNDALDAVDYLGYLGAIAARTGDIEEAQRLSKQLGEDTRLYLFGKPTFWRARILALLGNKEAAVNLLRQATKEGYAFSALHPLEDFEPLADYPPYIQLMKPKG